MGTGLYTPFMFISSTYKLFPSSLLNSNLKRKLSKIVQVWLDNNIQFVSAYAHNDLHCNNVIIDKEKNLHLIDFENLHSPGVWICDVLYFYATLFALFSSKPKIQNTIKKTAFNHIKLQQLNLAENLCNLLDIFCRAADANSRFRLQKKGINIFKILSFFQSLL